MSYNIQHTSLLNRPHADVSIVSTHDTEAEAIEALSTIKKQLRIDWPQYKFQSLSNPSGFRCYSDGSQELTISIYQIIED